jgi:uncharacterized protein (TIGR02646 family)
VSHQKCWYTEADDSVSDWHVDHFRPKANYQWLAFEWTNYRIAGANPNRKKSDYFPLEDPKTAASFGAQSTAAEEIILLDPTIPGDSDLIAFDEQGKVKPAKPSDPQAVKRVEASRDRFDMDTERLISKRLGVWNLCQKKLDQIRMFIQSSKSTHDALSSDHVKELADEVRAATRSSSPFSAVAKSYLRTTDSEWVLDIPVPVRPTGKSLKSLSSSSHQNISVYQK